ncbi:MAG: GTPase HflX [Lentisphaeria bacterium]|nr:GTPase HflX [Lentisphaeria bacterium]
MKHKTNLQVIRESPRMVEKALLVGIQHIDESTEHTWDMLDELTELTDTLGVGVIGRIIAKVTKPTPKFLTGSGKAEEIIAHARDVNADVVIFDDSLSPAQQRNWESLSTDIAIIDRQEVILDIFGQRAKTREAELQIALARARYDLPRLKRRWTHLHRQRGAAGGHGMRGEGEQQLEVDARLVRRRIARLETQLSDVRKKREVQRRKRMKRPVPNCAIVGYTNAGKSSLLNALTGADVLAEDKLFATLDPTIRRIVLPNQQELLLSDTVGFIRKLPHGLIEAFKATLEEAALADFLIEVIDINSPAIDEHHQTTCEVLDELGGGGKTRIMVFNKIDALTDEFRLGQLSRRFENAVFISARGGDGLDRLQNRLADELGRFLDLTRLTVPVARYDIVALLHRSSQVFEEIMDESGDYIHLKAAVPAQTLNAVKEFITDMPRS